MNTYISKVTWKGVSVYEEHSLSDLSHKHRFFFPQKEQKSPERYLPRAERNQIITFYKNP